MWNMVLELRDRGSAKVTTGAPVKALGYNSLKRTYLMRCLTVRKA